MGKDSVVALSDVLVKICTALKCKIDKIAKIVPSGKIERFL